MELIILDSDITEEVTAQEVKDMMGYPAGAEDQDARLGRLITVAREWLENRTGLSCVEKSYKAQFSKEERDSNGYYELPMSPVLSDPAIVVEVTGVATTFQQKGLSRVKVRPDDAIGTLRVGSSSELYYVDVTFTAGATNATANECIRRIAATMFNEPQDGAGESMNVSVSRLSYDTQRLIETIDQNTGL
jgi:hypothetical protein